MIVINMIFDKKIRSDGKYADRDESYYNYLDRSNRLYAEMIRKTINEWSAEYPDGVDKTRVINDLKSTDNKRFLSSFFELYVFEVFSNIGCRLKPHPNIISSKEVPDFLVTMPSGQQFYLEATVKFRSEEGQGIEKNKNSLISEIDRRLSNRIIKLDIEIIGEIRKFPKIKQLIGNLNNWLENLDKEAILESQRNIEQHVNLFSRKFNFDSYSLVFVPYCFSDGGEKAIIGGPTEGDWVKTDDNINNALSKKAKKYANLDKPLMIALNVLEFPINKDSVLEALLGKEIIMDHSDFENPIFTREGNGVFKKYTRVNAVLIISDITPWSMYDIRRSFTFYPHPKDEFFPNTQLIDLFPSYRVENGKYKFSEGEKTKHILQLGEPSLEWG